MNWKWALIALALVAMPPALHGALAPAPSAAEGTGEGFTEEIFTQPSKIINLAAAVGGIIKSRAVDEGSRVATGDMVVSLEDTMEAISVRAATLIAADKSDDYSAKATWDEALYEARIAKELSSQGVEAELLQHQKELAAEVARCKYEVAKKTRQKSGMDLEAAKVNLDHRHIRSPYNAVVTKMVKEVGEAVQPLDIVAQLAVTDSLFVIIHPPARMLGVFRPGQTLPIRVLEPKPQTVTAKVDIVNEVADAASNTFRVRLVLDNKDGRINSGVKVRVAVAGPQDLKAAAADPPHAAPPTPARP